MTSKIATILLTLAMSLAGCSDPAVLGTDAVGASFQELTHDCSPPAPGNGSVCYRGPSQALFQVNLPAGQAFVELFGTRNGVQNIANNIASSSVGNGTGRAIYSLLQGGYSEGDQIAFRFYSFRSGAPGVFTPGPTPTEWYSAVFSASDDGGSASRSPCTGRVLAPNEFCVDNYGAHANDDQDDGPAFRQALAAAVAAGAGSRVTFAAGVYRLGWQRSTSHQGVLSGVSNISIEGNSTTILSHPGNGLFYVRSSRGVTIRGFTLDYDPLPFTQGTITRINQAEGWLDFRIEPGYQHPVTAYEASGTSIPSTDSGAVYDAAERYLKAGLPKHFFMKTFSRSPAASDECRVYVTDEIKKSLPLVVPGDRWLMRIGYGSNAASVAIENSDDSLVEDFTIWSTKPGMTFAVNGGTTATTFRRLHITFKPNTTRLAVSSLDGIHASGNRVGPTIEDSEFDGLLDDMINISVTPYWIKQVASPRVYVIKGRPAVGDRLAMHTPARKEWLEPYVVVTASPVPSNSSLTRVTLDRELTNPVLNTSASDFPGGQEKMSYSGLYNLDTAGDGFVIRNNTFRYGRRHAMLLRARRGLIEGNVIDGPEGSAVYMSNEVGSFYEGPIPASNIIRNNTIRSTRGTPIYVGSTSLSVPSTYARNIEITNNAFSGSTPCIRQGLVESIIISGNTGCGQ